MAVTERARDLEADLAICEAATPGPWEVKTNAHPELNGKPWGWIQCIGRRIGVWSGSQNTNHVNDNRFIAAAREGWPYAIRRAMKAEEEIDRLWNELAIIQEQLSQSGRCWD